MTYTLKLLQGNMSIREDHGVRHLGVDIDRIGSLTPTTAHSGDVVWPCLVDGENGYYNAKAGDEWLHITSPIDGWVAIRHNGQELCKLVENTNSEYIIHVKDGVERKFILE